MSSPIQIAFACNDAYARHVAVAMRSILDNAAAGERHVFHIMTLEIPSQTESRLSEVANSGGAALKVHYVDRCLLAGFSESRYTLNAYLRLFLPEVLPDVPKVLYLDADVLAFSPLGEAWNLELVGSIAAAATDASYLFGGTSLAHFRKLELPDSHRYFNSGVMLMDLGLWRETATTSRIKEWATRNPSLMKFPDQDVLNVALVGKVKNLHLRWNLQLPLIEPVKYGWGCTREMADAVARPGIVHYTGTAKPWDREFPLPYQDLYFHYLSETPWGRDPDPPLTLTQRTRRLRRQADACYKWTRSEVRDLLGRHPTPTEELVRRP